ncbi:MAG TPA: hydroxymethylbilane synthase, partial [Polyangiaceae bacterium]|nr:hydroxymethylbilane synthase [Polyangiaceae bacterium]
KALRPDLAIVPLRGNVDTRLRKCEEGVVDAIVLARAGLLRLGLAERATEVLEVTTCLPAIGQGALGVEQRAGDERVAGLLARVTHLETAVAVTCERGVMHAVEGDCQTPVAAYAVKSGGDLWLRALLSEPDGSRLRRGERRTPWPRTLEEAAAIGRDLGAELKRNAGA